jgi:hypothetical protein
VWFCRALNFHVCEKKAAAFAGNVLKPVSNITLYFIALVTYAFSIMRKARTSIYAKYGDFKVAKFLKNSRGVVC